MALVDDIASRAARRHPHDGGLPDLMELRDRLQDQIRELLNAQTDAGTAPADRPDQANMVRAQVDRYLDQTGLALNALQRRNLTTALLNGYLAGKTPTSDPASGQTSAMDMPAPTAQPAQRPAPARRDELTTSREGVAEALGRLRGPFMERIDPAAAVKLPRPELALEVGRMLPELLRELGLQLNGAEQRDVVTQLVNDMLGLGPLDPLLDDPSITDILVNGPKQVYVERHGKLILTDVAFRDGKHLLSIAQRIVNRIGRRVDESSPMCDARLEDGSRVNIIVPPLAIDGASISIRKFAEKKITLEVMARQANLSDAMMRVLQIASRARLNILISGGTGSGKTTLLNALSRMIDTGERVVTIEDAAELQLQQPHVVRLETRPPNLEGKGEVTMRGLVKNALRMRPDRIILGEVRGGEALDMLQAMNTGHEGSMCTLHANNPREALTRLENMVGMSGASLPPKAVRTQIVAAIDMIVQVSRMRDGVRRVTSITEVVGMEGDIITTQELFRYRYEGEGADGKLIGTFEPAGLRPAFTDKAGYYGLERPLLDAVI
ncbi:MAG: CpaF family protein [Alphaproteobacteria bacterium]|nr:CpaF family protein [Alphaproteobacteria bacterium]